jgi:hypothetical protein
MADFNKEWAEHGYLEEMGSAKFLPPPDPEYVRAYHFASADHAIINIEQQRLKVARFSEVNDPFELLALNSHSAETRRRLAQNKDLHDRTRGLLCFSRNWTNPLLWSHYAKNHKGICLSFDLRLAEVSMVNYIERRLPANGLFELLLITKYVGWSYEQELRKFIDLSTTTREGALYFVSFDDSLRLKEVILGQRSRLRLEDIRDLVDSKNLKAAVFKTRLERRGFRIVGDGRYPPSSPAGGRNEERA